RIKRWHAGSSGPHTSVAFIDAALNRLGFDGEPAILEPDEAANPVLLDLFSSHDDHVRCTAMFRLAETLLHGTQESAFWSCGERAFALPSSAGTQIVLVLKNWHNVRDRDQDTHDLVLIDRKGRLLDTFSWSIDNLNARHGAPWRESH